MRPRRPASAIGDVLGGLLGKLEKKKLTQGVLDEAWKRQVGEAGYAHSRPAGLKKKVLTVRVDSSAWLAELSLRERKLLKGLKHELGLGTVTELNLRIGDLNG